MAQQAKNYFPHDYGARVKLAEMRRVCGLEGVGFYWCLVEILHEEGGAIKENLIAGIAYDLHIDAEKAMKVVKDFGLFTVRKGKVTNDRVDANIEKKIQVSQARRGAAEQRWNSRQQAAEAPADIKPDPKDLPPLDADTTERIDFFRTRINELLDAWEQSGDGDFGFIDRVDPIRRLLNNIFDEVVRKQVAKVDGEDIPADVFIGTMLYYFRANEEVLEKVIAEVEHKVAIGKVKNKENYLISTLYKTAKMSGE